MAYCMNSLALIVMEIVLYFSRIMNANALAKYVNVYLRGSFPNPTSLYNSQS